MKEAEIKNLLSSYYKRLENDTVYEIFGDDSFDITLPYYASGRFDSITIDVKVNGDILVLTGGCPPELRYKDVDQDKNYQLHNVLKRLAGGVWLPESDKLLLETTVEDFAGNLSEMADALIQISQVCIKCIEKKPLQRTP